MSEKTKRHIVVVLGMHRSGTSAITRGLQVLGVRLGDRMMPPVEGSNPKGFWEDIDFNALNVEMLNALDSDWCHVAAIEPIDVEILRKQDYFLRAVELLRQKVGSAPVFGFKDPRVAKLLPFWKEVFKHCQFEVSYLLAVRHPLSVVKSLAKRDGIEAEQSYLLWLGHVITSLIGSAGYKRVLVDYDRLMQKPDRELIRVAKYLGLEIDLTELQSYKNEFLDQGLRHTVYELNDLLLDNTCPLIVRQVYAALLDVASEEIKFDNLDLQNKVVCWSDEFERLKSPLLLVDKLLRQKVVATQAVTKCDGQIASLKQTVANRDGQIASLKQAVSESKTEKVALQDFLVESKKKIEELHIIAGQVKFLEQQLQISEAKVEEFLSSTSWRITKPLRVLRRRISKKNVQQVVQQVESVSADPDFDADFYRKIYPDIGDYDPYLHYLGWGKKEKRLPCAPRPIKSYELNNLNRAKETVLIVSHEASRSGAPILALNIAQHLKGKYNVVALLLRGGDLLADFHKQCDVVIDPFHQSYNQDIVSILLANLFSEVGFKFAIVNSIVSKAVLPSLTNNFIPSLCLIHEFASYTYPKNAIRDVLLWSSKVIFSSRIVYDNNAAQCEELNWVSPVILPQGKCVVPSNGNKDADHNQRVQELFHPKSLPDDTVIILGAGFVQMRKGVDLFLACVARVVALHPKNPFRFVWIGDGFKPDSDMVYSVYLQDQITRSGIDEYVCFTGELSDVDTAYKLSDVLFLSSRLDPLPNVAIDAMFEELPVICFDKTTGIADLLIENGLGESCVIPYLDVEQAAQRLVTLIENPDQRNRLGQEIKKVGEKLFDMSLYVKSLEQQALDCVAMQETEKSDCTLIEEDGDLNLDFYWPPSWPVAVSYKEAVRTFVRTWKVGIDRRKPFPGFHPGIYEDCHGLSQTGRNPLAAFIQAGRPEGPWLCDLIQSSSAVQMRKKLPFRVALHIHVFFLDLFVDILQRLEGQELPLDLLISVPSLESAEEVRSMVSGYTNGTVDIRTVPNRGRDIGPLLTEFSETILKNYDVIGHVHTKKSGDVKDAAVGQTWMNFLLENLIGKRCPMALTILERMAGNEQLGLVFPDDPNVIGWSKNKEIAENLAFQLGVNELPEHHFNFPIGTMFWARTEAIKPLLTKGFNWEDYPEEPLPYDGTILHALERLLPFVAQKMGYHVSMTHVSGITR